MAFEKIRHKIALLAAGLAEKLVEMELAIKEKKQKAKEDKKRCREMRESCHCPHCKKHYTSEQCLHDTTMKEDIEFKGNSTHHHVNFIKCECGELFGLKSTHFFHGTYEIYRDSFKLEDKDD